MNITLGAVFLDTLPGHISSTQMKIKWEIYFPIHPSYQSTDSIFGSETSLRKSSGQGCGGALSEGLK